MLSRFKILFNWNKSSRQLISLLLFSLSLPTAMAAPPIIQPKDDTTLTQTHLVNVLLNNDSGITVSNIAFTGSNEAAGKFTVGETLGFKDGIVLSTGKVSEITRNSYDFAGSRFSGNGDDSLEAIVGTDDTEDAVVLEFDFVPQGNTVNFRYRFASEEYPEYVDSGVNDAFAFFINGVNYALLPDGKTYVSIDTVNHSANSEYYVHNNEKATVKGNVVGSNAGVEVVFDALTTDLYVVAPVIPYSSNHIKLVIADRGDDWYDSAVFIEGGSFVSPHKLTIGKSGSGNITITVGEEATPCPEPCELEYDPDTEVTLTAVPEKDYLFKEWTGDCSGTNNPIILKMDAAKNCQAAFEPLQPLIITKTGTGNGTVVAADNSVQCGELCTAQYLKSTPVILTATPDANSQFRGWNGDCSGTENPLTLTMDAAKNCQALFEIPFALTVAKKGSGKGTVVAADKSIQCGELCTAKYLQNTQVVLTATPDVNSKLSGWSEDCSGAENSFTLTIDVAKKCTATFDVLGLPLTVEQLGSGSALITSEPAGVSIAMGSVEGTKVTTQFPINASIKLIVTPEKGTIFSGFGGDADCKDGAVTLTQALHCTVNLIKDTNPRPILQPQPLVELPCPTEDHYRFGLNEPCNAGGRTVTDLKIRDYGILANAVIKGTLTSTGWAGGSLTVLQGSHINGGIVTGSIDNKGTITNVELRGALITGGTLVGNITNGSKVKNELKDVKFAPGSRIYGGDLISPTFGNPDAAASLDDLEIITTELSGTIVGDSKSPTILENLAVKSGSRLENMTIGENVNLANVTLAGKVTNTAGSIMHNIQLAANTHLTGGQLSGKITSDANKPALLEGVAILPGSHLDNVTLGDNVILPENVTLGAGVQIHCTANGLGINAQGQAVDSGQACFSNQVVQENDAIAEIITTIATNPEHVGQKGELLMVIVDQTVPAAYMFTAGSWKLWDGEMPTLQPVQQHQQLPKVLKKTLKKADFANFNSDKLTLYIGYGLTGNGTVIYNGVKPIKFSMQR